MNGYSIISANYQQRLDSLGIETIGMEKLCPEYWVEITDAIFLMYNKFPLLHNSIKTVKIIDRNDMEYALSDLDVYDKYLFGCVQFPSMKKQNYDIIHHQTIYLGKNILNKSSCDRINAKSYKKRINAVNSVKGHMIHEIVHVLEILLTAAINNLHFEILSESDFQFRSNFEFLYYQTYSLDVERKIFEPIYNDTFSNIKKNNPLILGDFQHANSSLREYMAEMIAHYFTISNPIPQATAFYDSLLNFCSNYGIYVNQ